MQSKDFGRGCLRITDVRDSVVNVWELVKKLDTRTEVAGEEPRFFFKFPQVQRELFDQIVPKMPEGLRLGLDGVFVFGGVQTPGERVIGAVELAMALGLPAAALAKEVEDAIARHPEARMRILWFNDGEHGFYDCNVVGIGYAVGGGTMGVRLCHKHGEEGPACFVGNKQYPDVETAVAHIAEQVRGLQKPQPPYLSPDRDANVAELRQKLEARVAQQRANNIT
jgi:hypothetical protein